MNLIKIIDRETGEEKVGALNLDANDGNRILSCTFEEYAPPDQPRVTEIPDDNLPDYKYVDGEYVYDPLPQPEPPEPEPEPSGDDYVKYDELAEAIRGGVNSYGE